MDLFYRKYGSGKRKLIILHGFMGLSDHWVPVAKKMAKHFTIYIPDMRNHGQSFWSDEFSYQILARDLHKFMTQHEIKASGIIGHSMGGKVLLQYMLQHPEMDIKKPIIIDILPVDYSPNPEFKKMISLGKETDLSQFSTRDEIAVFLENNDIHDRFKRLILKNITLKNGKFQWKINIQAMYETFDSIFSEISENTIYSKPVYFIKGGASMLITEAGFAETLKRFPKAKLFTVEGASHWIHIEKASTLTALLLNILNGAN
jgi:pimeloyl-ACP methyl ester carboxylesterase